MERKKKSITWETPKNQTSSGEHAKAGRIVIGSWHWNGIDRDDSKRYVAITRLPGLTMKEAKFSTEEKAKEFVEKAFDIFFKEVSE